MNIIQTSLLALLALMILTLSMSLIADQTDENDPVSSELQESIVGDTGDTVANSGSGTPSLITASSRKPTDAGSGDSSTTLELSSSDDQQDKPHREKVWSDISEAITSLNDMVGDDMFRQLTRKSSTTMEVRVDVDYWQRVRYETRVDLKNDISNIWHLYVRQYNEDNESAVFFIDDRSGKTIDIFTQRRKSEE